MLILLIIVTALQAYVIGGVNGAIIISKYFYRKDIRKFGSGNPGLTNFYRVFGKGGAVLVVLIDVVKTVGPVVLGGFLFSHFLSADTFPSGNVGFFGLSFFGSELAGFFVMLGHCFPLFYEFRGGKGVMAMGTIVFFIDWRIALAAWGAFIVLTLATRYVSLGAVVGVLAYPLMVGLLGFGGVWEIVLSSACAALLIYRHRENIRRIFAGKESRFSFHRKKEA
ncbi:glycerol-3-phosphate acyltransferase PlsY [Sporobacter termitidis DSM 10068]|uniref:Glycerol-3-phosphate acyltransferase n=1 Tax=Sporobacter termitidis DSM 10068 TaxID=1123282 RepID=A0A1M5X1B5_9FIRM|nr:glycerol-3-phosphate 1-O-acyltransferase PlsY [Sporobacter termitidis]SHH93520.1 glycerol-3-phosphate acyltransferase PlsY [Sporobacter termitidis DSM 10068]